jgi:hypothetical protein
VLGLFPAQCTTEPKRGRVSLWGNCESYCRPKDQPDCRATVRGALLDILLATLPHCDTRHSSQCFSQPPLDHRMGITPDQPDPQRCSTMSRKIISTFTAAAMSMSIAMAIPVAVTAVSGLGVVSEAQAAKKISRKKSLAPRRGSNSNAPAAINCDIESSEECQKIVICSPNCSTEQMQGGDCC